MQGIIIIAGLIVLGVIAGIVWTPYGLLFFGVLAAIAGVAFWILSARAEGLPPETRENEREVSQGVSGEFRN